MWAAVEEVGTCPDVRGSVVKVVLGSDLVMMSLLVGTKSGCAVGFPTDRSRGGGDNRSAYRHGLRGDFIAEDKHGRGNYFFMLLDTADLGGPETTAVGTTHCLDQIRGHKVKVTMLNGFDMGTRRRHGLVGLGSCDRPTRKYVMSQKSACIYTFRNRGGGGGGGAEMLAEHRTSKLNRSKRDTCSYCTACGRIQCSRRTLLNTAHRRGVRACWARALPKIGKGSHERRDGG